MLIKEHKCHHSIEQHSRLTVKKELPPNTFNVRLSRIYTNCSYKENLDFLNFGPVSYFFLAGFQILKIILKRGMSKISGLRYTWVCKKLESLIHIYSIFLTKFDILT